MQLYKFVGMLCLWYTYIDIYSQTYITSSIAAGRGHNCSKLISCSIMKSVFLCAKVHPSKLTFLVPILTQLRLWDSHTGTPYNHLSLHASTGQVSVIHHALALVTRTPIK